MGIIGLVAGSMVFGLASEEVAEHVLAELDRGGLRFSAPVRHGHTLDAFTEVFEVPAADRPECGRGALQALAYNQNHVVFDSG
ncbi:MAG TPA: hypothetical protein VN886_07135 [Acidimicrobiales bacterium]|nr:hypothetical protein [Acidimicrobiales bacterium]